MSLRQFKVYWIFLFGLFASGHDLYSQEITGWPELTQVDPLKQTFISGRRLLFTVDEAKSLHIDSFPTLESVVARLRPHYRATPNFGFTANDVWIAFVLENDEEYTIPGFLQFDNPILDQIDVYKWSNSRSQFELIGQTGDQRVTPISAYHSKNLVVEALLPPSRPTYFLVRLNNGGEQFHFALSFHTSESIQKQDFFNQFFFGIYFGILIFVVIFNVFLYFSLREKLSLYYIFYLLSLGMLQLSLNGFGKQFLWTDSAFIANHMNPVMATTGILFLLLFVREFLELPKLMPRINGFMTLLAWIIGGNIVLSLVPNDFLYKLSVVLINGLTLVLTIVIIPIALLALRLQFKPARYFVLAFLFLVVAVGAFVLKNFGILESNAFSNYGLQYGSAIEVVLLSIAIIDRFKSFRDQSIKRLNELNVYRQKVNEELEEKVEQRTAEVLEQKQQITRQKQELEVRNQEVMSSIQYAKRIQEAILPAQDKCTTLLPHHALLYLPRDVVAGDFYWVEAHPEHPHVVCFAVADCTGHGVPGAMVSVLCSNAMNQVLRDYSTINPGEFLDRVDANVQAAFSSSGTQIRDGMDISLCMWDTKERQLYWAGANNALWLIRNGELTEWKPDKQHIGWGDEKKPFATHQIGLLERDRIVLFTDGLADQFGGPAGKKLKSKAVKELLATTAHLTLNEQISALQTTFAYWKGSEEQVDDVCVMGVEVNPI
jgi:two-component system, sensor histidine kinase LadS